MPKAKDRDIICIYCGQGIPYSAKEKGAVELAYKAAIDHDTKCEMNPLVQKIALLEAELEVERRKDHNELAFREGYEAAVKDWAHNQTAGWE